jgi:hypothetical protein
MLWTPKRGSGRDAQLNTRHAAGTHYYTSASHTPRTESRGPSWSGFGMKSRTEDRLAWGLSCFSSDSPCECRDSILKSGHGRFIPNPFQYITHQSPFHSMLKEDLVTEQASLNKLQTLNILHASFLYSADATSPANDSLPSYLPGATQFAGMAERQASVITCCPREHWQWAEYCRTEMLASKLIERPVCRS